MLIFQSCLTISLAPIIKKAFLVTQRIPKLYSGDKRRHKLPIPSVQFCLMMKSRSRLSQLIVEPIIL